MKPEESGVRKTEYRIQRLVDEQAGRLNHYRSKEILQGNSYKDVSTIIIIPTRGMIHCKVVGSWWNLIMPMNQKCTRVFASGMEVGEAYNNMIEQILADQNLSKWKYILTLEEDNIPPPDGLIRLYENMDKFDVIGGLYWTKGEEGQPMIYGEGKDDDIHFRPQPPVKDIQETDGLGMGFTLFKMDLFKNPKIEKPWFKTLQDWSSDKGTRLMTQDLYFFEKIRKLGYRVACDTRVKVGHYDAVNDIVW